METLKDIIISVSGYSLLISTVMIFASIVFSAAAFIKKRFKSQSKLKLNVSRLRNEKLVMLNNNKLRRIRAKLLLQPIMIKDREQIISNAKKFNLSTTELELAAKINSLISRKI